MKILGIDVGKKRTGIAFSDNDILASPLCTIYKESEKTITKEIAKIAREKEIDMIILGLPLNMDGSSGSSAEFVKNIGTRLCENYKIDVFYQDERLSTVLAHKFMDNNNIFGDKRKSIIDEQSAVIILQSYLDSKK